MNFSCSLPTCLGVLILLVGSSSSVSRAGVIFVDVDAPGIVEDGATWCTAYRFLQDALGVARAGDSIRVAGGLYQPDLGAGHFNGHRPETFLLTDGIVLQGGYAGCGDSNPNHRDIELHETILSGDLGQDDEPGFANYHNNAYHVVTVLNSNSGTVIDGVTIASGNTEGEPDGNVHGAGIYCIDGTLTVKDSKIRENRAAASDEDVRGGGICSFCELYVESTVFSGNLAEITFEMSAQGGGLFAAGETEIIGSIFESNIARSFMDNAFGGGAYMQTLSSVITGCQFVGNDVVSEDRDSFGGALHGINMAVSSTDFYNNSSIGVSDGLGGAVSAHQSSSFTQCRFEGNTARWGGAGWLSDLTEFNNCDFVDNFVSAAGNAGGGALFSNGDGFLARHCRFYRNEVVAGVRAEGGALHTEGGLDLSNCVFSGNRVVGSTGVIGGAIEISSADFPSRIASCTFAGNEAWSGGPIYVGTNSGELSIVNSVFWGNSPIAPVGDGSNDPFFVTYSVVPGGWPTGDGNVFVDPVFVDMDGADDIIGTEDDDLRLSPGSPSIDRGTNDESCVLVDINGSPRRLDDPDVLGGSPGAGAGIDMGAYEFVPNDCDDNGISDWLDIKSGNASDDNLNDIPDLCEPTFVDECTTGCVAVDNGYPDVDCNENSTTDICDILSGESEDCNENGIPDECDLSSGFSVDENFDNRPDECVFSGMNATMVPVHASGEELIDWVITPETNEITLLTLGQDVRFEVFLSGWSPYEFVHLQQYASCDMPIGTGEVGSYENINTPCFGDFDPDHYCIGLDEDRDDFVFADVGSVLTATDFSNLCPDFNVLFSGIQSSLISGAAIDFGGDYYAGTFAIHVPTDAKGRFLFGLRSDRPYLLYRSNMAKDIPVGELKNAVVNAGPSPALARGSRYIAIRPPIGDEPVAILVSGDPGNPAVSCVVKYVQADGSLGDDPVFQLPDVWGTINVNGSEIISDTRYSIQIDDGTVLSDPYTVKLNKFADVDQNGVVNFADILLSVNSFKTQQGGPWLPLTDIEPCDPNERTNFADILRTVLVFQGGSFFDMNCPLPCL